jgi:hypothetical protein
VIRKSIFIILLLFPLFGCAQNQLNIAAEIYSGHILRFRVENNGNNPIVLEKIEFPWEYGALGTIEFSAHGVAPKVARLTPLSTDIAVNNPLSNRITIISGQIVEGDISLDKLFPELLIKSFLSKVNIFWTYYLDACELGKQYLNTGMIRYENNKGEILFNLNEEFDITDDRTCQRKGN